MQHNRFVVHKPPGFGRLLHCCLALLCVAGSLTCSSQSSRRDGFSETDEAAGNRRRDATQLSPARPVRITEPAGPVRIIEGDETTGVEDGKSAED